jgi:hypothetical protein
MHRQLHIAYIVHDDRGGRGSIFHLFLPISPLENNEKMVSSEPSNLRKKWVPGEMIFSSWWKNVEFWPSIFIPSVECLTGGGGGRLHVDRCIPLIEIYQIAVDTNDYVK